jgi:hypothetical protein
MMMAEMRNKGNDAARSGPAIRISITRLTKTRLNTSPPWEEMAEDIAGRQHAGRERGGEACTTKLLAENKRFTAYCSRSNVEQLIFY